jgi:hypothetical protein
MAYHCGYELSRWSLFWGGRARQNHQLSQIRGILRQNEANPTSRKSNHHARQRPKWQTFLEQKAIMRIPQPPYSPDMNLMNRYIFRNIIEKTTIFQFSWSSENVPNGVLGWANTLQARPWDGPLTRWSPQHYLKWRCLFVAILTHYYQFCVHW